jgi:soluble lytic murein transglycosylase-like protein
MRIQRAIIAGGIAFLAASARPSRAEEKIQTVVSPNGRIVFTNVAEGSPPIVDNIPAAPATLFTETDVLAGEIPVSLRSLVDTISINHGVDPALVRAVIKTESNFNRWAVSNKGARGLMQLIPETGSRYGVRDFFDPQQNVEGGVQYLKFLLEKFNGNLDLSLAAYNAGENLVQKLGRIPPIPETTNYVRRVRANYVKKNALPGPMPGPMAGPITGTIAPAGLRTPKTPQTSGSQPAVAGVSAVTAAPQQPLKEAKQQTASFFRTVDEHGVVHFSNVGPPNRN